MSAWGSPSFMQGFLIQRTQLEGVEIEREGMGFPSLGEFQEWGLGAEGPLSCSVFLSSCSFSV